MVVITKLRFPCRCIRANVRYHWLLGSARAQPWICIEALFFLGGGEGEGGTYVPSLNFKYSNLSMEQ